MSLVVSMGKYWSFAANSTVSNSIVKVIRFIILLFIPIF